MRLAASAKERCASALSLEAESVAELTAALVSSAARSTLFAGMGCLRRMGPDERRGGVSLNVTYPSRFPSHSQRQGGAPQPAKRHRPCTVPVAILRASSYGPPMTMGELGHTEEHRRLERALEIADLGEFEWDM